MKKALIVFAVLLPATAFAGFDEGLAAYDSGNFFEALRNWQPLAERGDANAQFNLGLIYENGRAGGPLHRHTSSRLARQRFVARDFFTSRPKRVTPPQRCARTSKAKGRRGPSAFVGVFAKPPHRRGVPPIQSGACPPHLTSSSSARA